VARLWWRVRLRQLTVWAGLWGLVLAWGCGEDPSPAPPTTEEPPVVDPRCPESIYPRPRYLHELVCPRAFSSVATTPDTSLFANASSVKFVIDLQDDDATYFMDGVRYDLHFTFCSEELDKPGFDPVGTHREFNERQYRGSDRRFLLGTVTYYGDQGVVAMEFATGDAITAPQVLFAYRHIVPLLYFGDALIYRPISLDHERAAREELEGELPIIYTEDLYAGITYQPLNGGESYGYLRLVGAGSVDGLRPTDIAVLTEAPNDIPPVAGVVTESFQTPLSHVNILSKNRGTPNMALRGVFSAPDFVALADKLVRLRVERQRYVLEAASLTEAEAYWDSIRPTETFVPPLDLTVGGLPDLNTLDLTAIPAIGAKASHMAEMTHIDPPVPLPDRPFAVPFVHYREHMHRNHLDERVEAMLSDARFMDDPVWRARELALLREAIETASIDRDLVASLYAKVGARWGDRKVRFRSSTNSEDLANFNGAGLYVSYSGQTSGGRPLEDAARKVWASLWTDAAAAERDFYRIDHRTVAMALLVHPAFVAEEANGVALTVNLFNTRRPGYYINVQAGEASVTNPGPGDVPDQFILYTWYDEPEAEYLALSNLNGGEPVLSWPEILEMYAVLTRIHDHFKPMYFRDSRHPYGMDVEFKFEGPERQLIIKQARPIPQGE